MPTLEWIGKDKVINHHLEVPFRVLDRQYSFDEKGQHAEDNGSENMIIKGDNLEALKALLPRYEGKVKCIYIDPPYNTGNEGWVYNDNVNDPKIKKWLGEVVGKEGEDLSRHDKWLCMMYPRLKLLRQLLAEDGVIFISIDNNEVTNLKFICDEIFGTSNFVDAIVWQKRTSPDARKKISTGHEYILVYLGSQKLLEQAFNLLTLNDEDIKKFKNPDNDPRGPWVSTDFTAQGYRPNQMYTITAPGGKRYTPTDGHCWKNIEEVYLQQLAEGRFWFGNNRNGVPRRKTYLFERKGKNIWTWWSNKEVGHTQEATQELTEIFGTKTVFDFPKPSRLIMQILQIATQDCSVILDSFAGSGTTAHAVLKLNKKDMGKRKFILVEMEDYAETTTAERVKRVIKGYSNVPGTGGDFSFYELGQPLLIDGENLNEEVGVEKIREYVWFTETKQAFAEPAEKDNSAFLGIHADTGYYFHYIRERATVLDHAFLSTVRNQVPGYVIYADLNALSPEELKQFGITFKKIPRDIAKL